MMNIAQAATHHEPFVRMIKRDTIPRNKAILIRAIAAIAALVTGGLLLLLLGHNPIAVYGEMIAGSLGSPTGIKDTVRIAIPLLISGIGIAVAFKMRFWNIGGEGQILAGATAAAYFALFQFDSMPRPVLLIVMAIVAILAGGIMGSIPAFFKAKWGTNETLFTLMLNYIALAFVNYLRSGPWRDPKKNNFPVIALFNDNARLPSIFGVHIGWIVALALVVIMYLYFKKSKQGYEISVVGESVNTAKYAGMHVGKVLIRSMFLSGALLGLVGFLQASGANYTLTENTAGGVGFTAITVAWLSKLNPIVMLPVAFFIAILEKGAGRIQTTFKIPASAAEVLTGIILFFMLGCEFFINYKLVFRKRKEKAV